jgi:hypothetical protein
VKASHRHQLAAGLRAVLQGIRRDAYAIRTAPNLIEVNKLAGLVWAHANAGLRLVDGLTADRRKKKQSG